MNKSIKCTYFHLSIPIQELENGRFEVEFEGQVFTFETLQAAEGFVLWIQKPRRVWASFKSGMEC